jgi:hypothetical protein
MSFHCRRSRGKLAPNNSQIRQWWDRETKSTEYKDMFVRERVQSQDITARLSGCGQVWEGSRKLDDDRVGKAMCQVKIVHEVVDGVEAEFNFGGGAGMDQKERRICQATIAHEAP